MRLGQEDPDNYSGEAIVLRDFIMVHHQVLITNRHSEKGVKNLIDGSINKIKHPLNEWGLGRWQDLENE